MAGAVALVVIGGVTFIVGEVGEVVSGKCLKKMSHLI